MSSSSTVNTREERRVVLSSSLVLIHLGGVTMWSEAAAYVGLHVLSSWWTISALSRDLGPWFTMVCVLTPSIWILNQRLSSNVLVSCPWLMWGRKVSAYCRRSAALWSAQVEMMGFPWLLYVAAMNLMCFALSDWEFSRVLLIRLTIIVGLRWSPSLMPSGRYCMTTWQGW